MSRMSHHATGSGRHAAGLLSFLRRHLVTILVVCALLAVATSLAV